MHSNNGMFVASKPATNEEQDLVISRALRKAGLHAERVCKREHIKAADRIQRVGHFITSLRRELNYTTSQAALMAGMVGAIIHSLCNAGVWYDIGIATGAAPPQKPGYTVGVSDINRWLDLAHCLSYRVEDQCELLEADLEMLERDLTAVKGLTATAERINNSAGEVLSELQKVLSSF